MVIRRFRFLFQRFTSECDRSPTRARLRKKSPDEPRLLRNAWSTLRLEAGKSEVRSEVEWFCQKCGTGNWWSRTDCRHCASVTNDAADAPQTSAQEKIAVLEKMLAGMGNDEPILAGKRGLEKELEKHQRKLNGPKNTAKHIEAKENWINRESKRIESESAKLAEMQENLRVRKET